MTTVLCCRMLGQLDMTKQARDTYDILDYYAEDYSQIENYALEHCNADDAHTVVDEDDWSDMLHHEWEKIFKDFGITEEMQKEYKEKHYTRVG